MPGCASEMMRPARDGCQSCSPPRGARIQASGDHRLRVGSLTMHADLGKRGNNFFVSAASAREGRWGAKAKREDEASGKKPSSHHREIRPRRGARPAHDGGKSVKRATTGGHTNLGAHRKSTGLPTPAARAVAASPNRMTGTRLWPRVSRTTGWTRLKDNSVPSFLLSLHHTRFRAARELPEVTA